MKRYTIFIYSLLLFTLAAVGIRPVQAQQRQSHQYALYNYRNDGDFNAWLNIDIDSITYSRIDTLGVEHDDVVVQEVWTSDSLYRIPLEAIDSIGFRAPKPELASNIIYIRDYHAAHTTSIDGLTIHFTNTIHNDSIPSVGQVVLSATEATPYEEGFAGKVIDVQYDTNGVSVVCEEVSIGDIYKRLVVVGKVSNDVEKYPSLTQTSRRSSDPWVNYEEDGVIPIELDKKEFSIGDLVKITSPTPKLTCSYYIYISELYYEGNVKLDLYHPDLTYTLTFTLDQLSKYSEFGKLFAATFSTDEELQTWLEEYKDKKIKDYLKEEEKYEKELSKQWFERSKIKIPIPTPVSSAINLELEISPIVKAKGKLELSSEFKTDAWQSMTMKWKGFTPLKILSLGKGLPDIPIVNVSARQDPFKSAKLDLKAKGTLTLGFKTLLNVNLVHKDLIYLGLACDAAREVGGTIDVTILDTERPEMNMYERLKDTNLKISTYARGYAEAGTTPYKFLSASTPKYNIYTEEYVYNLLPHFTEPALPKYNNGTWQGKKPLGFFSYPSKDIFIPCKIGMRIVDEGDNHEAGESIKEYQESYRYLDEYDWRNKYVEIDVSDLPSGNYRCYPTISFFGWKPFNAGPVHKFTVPLPLVASPAKLYLSVGGSAIVDYFGGWDTFAVVISGDDKVASIIKDNDTGVRHIKVKGLKKGDSELQIEDRRTGEIVKVPIIVTDTPVNQSTIYVNTKTIDFGTVKENETKTEYFSVVNSGDYDLKFTVGRATAPFNIPEAGEEFTLAAGDTKVFAVTCSGLKSDDGTKTQFIPISSDASNASADFGITLTAKCETPAGNEAYALYNNGTLTFYYDGERTLKDGKTYDLPSAEEKPDWWGKSTIKRVVFDASFASYKSLTSTFKWFEECRELTDIMGIENLNTDNVTNMSSMFSVCTSLKNLDLSHFNTNKVTNMSEMFFCCTGLTSLDLSHFDTSKVTDMSKMFDYCKSLTSLEISHFNTSKVTDMNNLFFGCSDLTNLDLSNFETSSVTNMSDMFSYCSGLSSLDLSHFNTSCVTNMEGMFYGCSGLTSLDVTHFDTSNVTDMSSMFKRCSGLTNLDLSHFDTSKLNDTYTMFEKCTNLRTIYCSGDWNVEYSINMFSDCTNLVGGKGTKYDSNHTDAEYARIDGGSESPGYFTGVNASAGSVLTITPTEIDFGVVELGTNENKAITVTNTGSGTLTFTAYSDPSFTKFFEMSDSGVEFTLEPGTTKDLTITCHGIETGNRASSNIVVISNAEDNTKYVRLTVVGTDSEPLVETSSLNLSVGEEKILAIRTEGFEFVNSNPEFVKATRGGSTTGGGGGELGDYDFQSNYSFGTGHLVIEAIAAGIATVKITDKATGKEDILTVTVSSSSTDVPAEAVDLGLPSGTKWASYNVGATKPEEFGGYYAWGETEVKDSYTNDNYQYKDTYQELGRNICFTDYDVAHVKWGDAWRMPTGTEFNELWNNCNHTWTTVNGVNGMRLTGSNGNSIFLPAAGNYYESLVNEANFGFYRAGTYTSSSFFEPDYFTFDSSGINGIGDCFGTEGLSVRPVLDSRGAPIIRVFPQEIDFGVVKQGTDKTKTFKVTNVSNANVTFHIDGSSQFSYRFEVSDNKVSCTLAPGESREFTVTCHGMEATCEAFTSILVKSDTNDEEYKVSLSAVGDDDTPLIDETSMTLAVGERGFVTVNTMSYHISTEDGQIVYWEEFGYSKETKLEDGYDSKEKNGYAKPAFIAKRAGAAVVTFTNKDASKTAVLTITVTDASTSY